jgi:hypothetical protein
MESLLDGIKNTAIKLLKKDGVIYPVFFIVQGETLIISQPTSIFDKFQDNLNAEDYKSRAVYCMGALAKVSHADRLIMIWDAAMRTLPSNIPYDPTEAPLSYPKSMRVECIIIIDISFTTGQDKTIVIPYKGGDGEPVEMLSDVLPKEATFKTRFTEIALEGYNKIQ